jgi:hypothetical protein
LSVKAHQTLIERTHADIFALFNRVTNGNGSLRIDDHLAHARVADHDFVGGNSALLICARNQALRDHTNQSRCQLRTNRSITLRGHATDHTINRLGGIIRVQRA